MIDRPAGAARRGRKGPLPLAVGSVRAGRQARARAAQTALRLHLVHWVSGLPSASPRPEERQMRMAEKDPNWDKSRPHTHRQTAGRPLTRQLSVPRKYLTFAPRPGHEGRRDPRSTFGADLEQRTPVVGRQNGPGGQDRDRQTVQVMTKLGLTIARGDGPNLGVPPREGHHERLDTVGTRHMAAVRTALRIGEPLSQQGPQRSVHLMVIVIFNAWVHTPADWKRRAC